MRILTTIPLILPAILASHIRLAVPSGNGLPSSTTATLTTLLTTYSAPIRTDNTFDFRNVSTGSYLLDIHCSTNIFAPLRVDVHEGLQAVTGDNDVKVWGTFRGNEWGNKGEAKEVLLLKGGEEGNPGPEIYWFSASVGPGKDYFIARTGCEPLFSVARTKY
jgi:hypothetical protein